MADAALPLRPSMAVFLTFFLTTLPLHHASPSQAVNYIVHMDRFAMPRAFSDQRAWFAATLSAAAVADDHLDDDSSGLPHLIYAYDHAIHGFSARLSPSQLEQLKRSRGFLHAHEEFPVELDTTYTPDFMGLNQTSGIWPETHYGEGAIIGVVDTGVWPESQSYGDAGMGAVPSRWRGACEAGDNFTSSLCNRKLIGARGFNRGLVARDPNVTFSDNSPRDNDGHGTHTSSTAAGNWVSGAGYYGYGAGTARGAAPRAHLAVYKVTWAEGSTEADVLAGIDGAISDGVDVVSLSMRSGGRPLYDNPIAIAAFAAMEKGIFVATTAGNRGPDFTSLRQGIPWALTVGASTTDRRFAGEVVLGDGTVIPGGSVYTGKPESTKQLPLALVADCQNQTLLKQSRNRVVVCGGVADDENWFDLKNTVRPSRLRGAIFVAEGYNIPGFSTLDFPAAVVDPKDGKRLRSYATRSSHPTASLRFRKTVFGIRPAPEVARYSSRGPSRSCPYVMKPDLVAPGTQVMAAYVPRQDNGNPFSVLQGTSMACPHAAGVAAMLKVVHPDWSPAAIRSAMMTTARTSDNTGGAIRDPARGKGAATPFDMGSGQVDPNKALDPGLVYDAGAGDYRKLLCALNYTEEEIQVIIRSPGGNNTVGCSDASLDLNYPSFVAYFDPMGDSQPSFADNNRVRVFRRTVTSVAEGEGTYTAEVAAIAGFGIEVRPRKLVFGGKNEKRSFSVRVVRRRELVRDEVVHGWLRWVDRRRGRVVSSPVVVSSSYNLPGAD